MDETREICEGCRLVVPALAEGPDARHQHMGAAPGCWSLYTRLLSLEYRELGAPCALTPAAYAGQHPGKPSRRESQSMAVNLMTLGLVFERGLDAAAAVRAAGRIMTIDAEVRWLEPPQLRGETTVQDVLDAWSGDAEAHRGNVEAWAREVWRAWAAQHAAIREWIDRFYTPYADL